MSRGIFSRKERTPFGYSSPPSFGKITDTLGTSDFPGGEEGKQETVEGRGGEVQGGLFKKKLPLAPPLRNINGFFRCEYIPKAFACLKRLYKPLLAPTPTLFSDVYQIALRSFPPSFSFHPLLGISPSSFFPLYLLPPICSFFIHSFPCFPRGSFFILNLTVFNLGFGGFARYVFFLGF